MNTPHTKGWLADFLLLAAIWGSSFLFLRVAALDLGALPTAAMRVAIASAHVYPVYPDWLERLLEPFNDPATGLATINWIAEITVEIAMVTANCL